MKHAPALRTNVLEAKQRLAAGRERLEERRREGALGRQLCGAATDLLDTIVLDLYEQALTDLGEDGPDGLRSQVALAPHGGYGRRDVAPYSDVDLMILHTPASIERVARLAERLMRDLFDAGLQLGQSVRTVRQACQLARGDATIYTSLVEARYLAGSVQLYSKFARSFARMARRRQKPLLAAIDEARSAERRQYGETVYLLAPNVKRSRGGLRDLQLVRWVGFTRYGTAEFDGLRLAGALEREDYEVLRRATEFLLRLRNEMHFYAGKSNDVLDRAEQVRLAELYEYEGAEGVLPVEQFMQEYFRVTRGVSHVVTRFVAGARDNHPWQSLLAPLVSHQFEGDFRVGPRQISANRRGEAKLHGDLAQVLRLADLANLYDKPIAYSTHEAIRAAVRELPDEVTPDVAQRFLSLLSRPGRLADLLRDLHDMGALEKIVPALAHARCLLQFNEYHKFTVDEHCLRAVECATELLHDQGTLGWVYERIKRKWLLHLALLLHDLGKGYPEDHSEVGLRLAEETAARLGLSERDTEDLKFLVHKHLQMSHLAFRRDTSDEQLIVRFAVEVGAPEVLRMLLILTVADLAAVGPGVLNAWKVEVLSDLYHRAMKHLAGDVQARNPEAWRRERIETTLALLRPDEDRAWFEQQLKAFGDSYLRSHAPAETLDDLRPLKDLKPGDAIAHGHVHPETGTVEYRVGTYEQTAPGVFHRLTGALAAKGLQILSAEIDTLADGLVFDRFTVIDGDFSGTPPDYRLDEVSRALSASITTAAGAAPTFRRVWRSGGRRSPLAEALPTRVRIDNSASDRCTVIDVFAADRLGLLYTIGRTLFEMDLSVEFAKIGTYLDQVVDVFYVTDARGKKIEEDGRMAEIRTRLLAAVTALEQEDTAAASDGAAAGD